MAGLRVWARGRGRRAPQSAAARCKDGVEQRHSPLSSANARCHCSPAPHALICGVLAQARAQTPRRAMATAVSTSALAAAKDWASALNALAALPRTSAAASAQVSARLMQSSTALQLAAERTARAAASCPTGATLLAPAPW